MTADGGTSTTILVTGGGGFVGSALVPRLLAAGHRVRVLDLFLFRAPFPPTPRLEVLVGDVRDAALVTRALNGAEAVIHLAAMSNDPSGDLDPVVTREINHDATLALGAAAARVGVTRFVNVSSASVYGVREEGQVVEELPPRPQTLYARFKAETEAALLALNTDDFLVTSVRPATLSGYTPRLRLDLTVNILTSQAVTEGRLRVFGGDQFRPNLSVHDLVRALLDLLRRHPAQIRGRTFNLVEGNYRVREIADRVVAVLGLSGMPIETVPTDDTRSYRLCGDRARTVLGFVPQYSLDHSIRSVATALTDRSERDPSDPRHRNVEHLRRQPLQSWAPAVIP
jgi:nucleoside-diphosphate-sugar epimerase